MKRLLFIFNPMTGGGRLKNRLMAILCAFAGAGYEIVAHPTVAQGDARSTAEQKAQNFDLVICCGGDGTLNEVVNGLMQHANPPPLGYIPGGTTNDFASSLQIPKNDMLLAAEHIVRPKNILNCDLGSLNGRYFTYVAAFGAFTDVSYKTPQSFKNVLGYFAYLLEGIQRLPNLPICRIHVKAEKEFDEEVMLGMITNSTSVGGFSNFDKNSVHLDDGLFEVLLVRQPHSLADVGGLSAALLTRDTSSSSLVTMRVKEITIESEEPLPWTLDGEYGGELHRAHIKVHHGALKIYV